MLAYNFGLTQEGSRFNYNVSWIAVLFGSILLGEFSNNAVVEHVGSFAAAKYIVIGFGESIYGCVASCQKLWCGPVRGIHSTAYNEIRRRNQLK
jgi:hypothetical protein